MGLSISNLSTSENWNFKHLILDFQDIINKKKKIRYFTHEVQIFSICNYLFILFKFHIIEYIFVQNIFSLRA